MRQSSDGLTPCHVASTLSYQLRGESTNLAAAIAATSRPTTNPFRTHHTSDMLHSMELCCSPVCCLSNLSPCRHSPGGR
jgi:hypothetical protein